MRRTMTFGQFKRFAVAHPAKSVKFYSEFQPWESHPVRFRMGFNELVFRSAPDAIFLSGDDGSMSFHHIKRISVSSDYETTKATVICGLSDDENSAFRIIISH